jgi:PPM family protein phosphatase
MKRIASAQEPGRETRLVLPILPGSNTRIPISALKYLQTPAMTISCPTCQSPIQSDDRFCENCGTPLQAPSAQAPLAQASSVQSRTTRDCQKCGAPASSIDADGFCDRCGFRNVLEPVTREFDQVAEAISPTFAANSDRGISHHQNEDYFAIASMTNQHGANQQILVVCDGVSSSTTPQLASQLASKVTCDALAQIQQPITPEHLEMAIQAAQTAVAELATNDDPPSTTIVAAVIDAGIATIGWQGDSRAYWIDADQAIALTTDHSWFNEQVESGQLSIAEAHQDPKAHAITRWIGADADREPASTVQFSLPGPGYFVLCSDGLWNYLTDAAHLATLIASTSNAATIAQRLVDYANAKGGKDNITVAVAIIE